MQKQLILLMVLLISGHLITAQKFEFQDKKEGVLLTWGDREIYFYQAEMKSQNGRYARANYIHPLYGINGEILTEDFPEDHLHHRGIFWAWHQFYVNNEKVGDPWSCQDISWEVRDVEHTVSREEATLKTELFWMGQLSGDPSPSSGQEKLLKENTTIKCRRFSGQHYEFDFEIELTALHEGTKLGGSEDEKGYGGFSARIILPEDLSFYGKNGKVVPKNTAVQAEGWINIQGTFDPAQNNQSAITIMYDPKAQKHFHGWILRSEGSMQNAAYPGREPVAIEKGSTLTLRYKLVLHPDSWSREKIENIYNKFLTIF